MIIQVTARHFQASDALKGHVTDRFRDLTRYHENIISGHIILSSEDRNRRGAEVIVSTKRKHMTASGQGENLGLAIDEAFTRVERQLKKFNEKKKGHKERGLKNSLGEREPV